MTRQPAKRASRNARKPQTPAILQPTDTTQPAAPPPLPAEMERWIDELGALEEDLAPHQAKIKRIPELRNLISTHSGLQADQTGIVHGREYTAMVGARKFESVIDIVKVFAKVGKAKFLRACSITQKAMADVLEIPEAERDALVTKEQTGPRDVKTYRNPAAIRIRESAAMVGETEKVA